MPVINFIVEKKAELYYIENCMMNDSLAARSRGSQVIAVITVSTHAYIRKHSPCA
jgi:hypothetical protein